MSKFLLQKMLLIIAALQFEWDGIECANKLQRLQLSNHQSSPGILSTIDLVIPNLSHQKWSAIRIYVRSNDIHSEMNPKSTNTWTTSELTSSSLLISTVYRSMHLSNLQVPTFHPVFLLCPFPFPCHTPGDSASSHDKKDNDNCNSCERACRQRVWSMRQRLDRLYRHNSTSCSGSDGRVGCVPCLDYVATSWKGVRRRSCGDIADHTVGIYVG